LPKQPGYETNVIRVANRAVVDAHIGAMFRKLTRDQAAAKLRAANTAYGFVNDVAAFSHHPALRRETVETPNGPVAIAAPPVLREAARPLGPVPGIGAHSAAIRAEFAA
jgi:crotonobetainyl-CoA:carnitine CoA-transferase CaiB-like acyl-CoA transferase